MQRLDDAAETEWVSAVVYGPSGSGKTSLGATAPQPLIALSERQGMLHIRQAAHRQGKPVPPVIYCQSLTDVRQLLKALWGPKTEPFRVFKIVLDEEEKPRKELMLELPVEQWPQTVVLDSYTDICRLVVEEIRRESPPKKGKDGLPVDSERYWNVLGDRCTGIMMGFRDAPVHKLFLCLDDNRIVGEGDEARRSLGPDLPMRKLAAKLSSVGNLTAYSYKKETRDKKTGAVTEDFGAMTRGPEYMLLKGCAPLRPVEVQDFGYWVQAIRGALLVPPPAAPSASVESLVAAEERLQEAAAESGPASDPGVDQYEDDPPPEEKAKPKTNKRAAKGSK